MEPLPPPASQRSAVPAQRPAPPAPPADVPPGLPPAATPNVPGARTPPTSDAPAPPTAPMPSVPAQRAPAGPPVPSPQPRPGRLRPLLAVLGGMLALLCLGGAGVAYVLYDGATAPDRSAPDVVVDNYLRAYLVDRDDTRADLYVCRGAPDLDALRFYRDDIADRERKFSIHITVSWGSLIVASTETGRRVTTEVRRTIADGSEQAQDRWQFDLVDQDGWRVCDARRLG